MPISTTTIPTNRASVYLQQLCKHFGHKVPAEFDANAGRIELPFGECRLAADDAALTMIVEGTQEDLPRLERVIGDHLTRFAFREAPTFTWEQGAPA